MKWFALNKDKNHYFLDRAAFYDTGATRTIQYL